MKYTMANTFVGELDEQLKYFEAIVKYLDKSGNLDLIQAQATKFKEEKQELVYTFKLLIDPADIIEENAYIGNLLLCQPVQATRIFQEVIYKTILVLQLLPTDTSLSQVAVILRFSSLPNLSHMNEILGVACLSRVYDVGIFCKMVGMVTGTSAVSKYTQSTRYYCPDPDCEGHKGNQFIRVHVPGASETQTVRKDFTCSTCLSRLVEEKSKRTLSDKVLAEVIPQKVLTDINCNLFQRSRGQVVPVFIRDNLTKVVEIGEVFELIGTVRKDITDDNINMMIEVNNIQKVIKKVTMKTLLQKIPRNVLKLFKDRRSFPWSFGLTLAYLFGADICPPGSYFNLKLLILLSLMSATNKKVKPVHILAIGEDTEPISRLLQFGLKFKDHNSVLTANQGVSGRVTLDKYKCAPYFIEGGVLHLSQKGVCYAGDVGRLKKSTADQLQHALSSGKIVTTVGSKYTEGLPQHIEEKLSSRVWGFVDTSAGSKVTKPDGIFYACSTGTTPKQMLESFSILSFIDSGDMSTYMEVTERLTEQVIKSARNDNMSEVVPITTDDFHKFLRFAERLDPGFTKEAETLIQSYFLACRKSRMSANTTVPLSVHQTLMSLAYSHAKLSLRSYVTIDDALMAIKLCEESLTARFGSGERLRTVMVLLLHLSSYTPFIQIQKTRIGLPNADVKNNTVGIHKVTILHTFVGVSVLSVQPLPHVSSLLMSCILGPEHDGMMFKFHKSLLRFCSLASGLEE